MMVLVPVGCIPPDGHADYTRVKELAREKVLTDAPAFESTTSADEPA
jgi:hypothetical protein